MKATKVLPVELLQTLLLVREHGTFAGAAEAVYRTQSSVSQQMKVLENLVGMPLFDQVGRRKVLNKAGEVVCSHANTILIANQNLMRTLDLMQRGVSESVSESVVAVDAGTWN